jgi:autotransporter-associated beta strand protein
LEFVGTASTTHFVAGNSVGPGAITNAGLLRHTGAGTTSFTAPFNTLGGSIDIQGGALSMSEPGDTILGPASQLTNGSASLLRLRGDLVGDITSQARFSPGGEIQFLSVGTAADPARFEALSNDLGPNTAGFRDNFVYNSIHLQGTFLRLVDDADNSAGGGNEAAYFGSLIVDAASTLDLNSLNLYVTTFADIRGTILNGQITVVDAVFVAQNDGPIVATEDTAITLTESQLLGNDLNPPGAPLVITAVSDSQFGVAKLNGDRSITFTPDANFFGEASFNYTVAGAAGTDTARVTLSFAPVNEVDAKDDTFTTPIAVPVFFGSRGVLANDVDPEGNAVGRARIVTGPANGIVTLNSDGSFTYTSNAGFLGIDSFTYRATDSQGATDVAKATINVIDAAPTAKGNEFAVQVDSKETFIDVLKNDGDPEGNKLEVIAITQPQNGKATLTPQGVTYEPNPGFVGADEFTYTVSDDDGDIGINATAVALVSLFIVPVSQPYFPIKDEFTRPEDTIVTLTEADLVSNDYNRDMAPVDIASVSNFVGGTAMLNPDGSVTFTPTANFVGLASFRYTCAAPLNIGSGLVEIDFTPILDAPVSVDDGAAVESAGNEVTVLVNDIDGDGDLLTVSAVTQAQRGTVSIGLFGLDVVYTPPPDFVGSETFTYTVSDGNGGSDTATVTVLVGPGAVGTAGDDVFLVRLDAQETNIEVFANETGAGAPIFSALATSLTSLQFVTLDGNDRLIVDLGEGNPLPTIEYQSGTGSNTLDVPSGSVRIDAHVAAGGVLDTTVGAGAELITNRFRQRSLTLSPGSRATVLPADTLDAVSRLDALTIGTGATLDLNDNALVLDYTGASPEAAIRAKILEGRGGPGIGNGNWNGTGITSSAAAAANLLDPESRSIGYADNGTLPLGAYATFRGQAVDATSLLIAFTRTADANLDSLVDDNDVTVLGAFFPAANSNWASGDFDYSGTVDDNDATLVGAFYDPGAIPFPAAAPARGALATKALRTYPSPADLQAAADAYFSECATATKTARKLHRPIL